MHWDVVELNPQLHQTLFIRFRDGVSGELQLNPDDLTGVLAPLKDPAIFRQAFIEHGAVTWPGQIDLAPDAMYREIVANRQTT